MFLKCITFSGNAVILQLFFVDILKTFLQLRILRLYLSVRRDKYIIVIIFPSLKKYETPIFILITLFFAQTGDLCAALV